MTAAIMATSCGKDTPPPVITTEDPEFNITFAAFENGSAKAFAGNTEVTKAKAGDIITVKATADDTFHFAGWSSSPVTGFDDAAAETTDFLMPDKDITITALFSKDTYMLSFAVNPEEAGTVTVTVDGTAIASGDQVEVGASVTIEATKAAGYAFVGWSGIDLDDASATEAVFEMPAEAVSITAAFDKSEYALNFAADPVVGGTVTVTVDGAAIESGDQVEVGASVTIMAEAVGDYIFTEWSGIDLADASVAETTFEMPDGEVSITASFLLVEWVQIGATKWAKYNVEAPGEFATTPEDIGMYYQFGYSIGWDGTVSTPANGTYYNWMAAPLGWGDTSAPINDPYGQGPCPDGYTVPTSAQANALIADCDQSNTSLRGVSGKQFTVKGGSESIFFPFAGWNPQYTPGSPSGVGSTSYYWLNEIGTLAGPWTGSSQGPPPFGAVMSVNNSSNTNVTQQQRAFAVTVRCVKVE